MMEEVGENRRNGTGELTQKSEICRLCFGTADVTVHIGHRAEKSTSIVEKIHYCTSLVVRTCYDIIMSHGVFIKKLFFHINRAKDILLCSTAFARPLLCFSVSARLESRPDPAHTFVRNTVFCLSDSVSSFRFNKRNVDNYCRRQRILFVDWLNALKIQCSTFRCLKVLFSHFSVIT